MDSPSWPGWVCFHFHTLPEASSCKALGHLGWHVTLGAIWLLHLLQALASLLCDLFESLAISLVVVRGSDISPSVSIESGSQRPVQLFPECHSVACLCRKATCPMERTRTQDTLSPCQSCLQGAAV